MLAQTHMRCAGLDRRHRIVILDCVGVEGCVAAGDVNTVQSGSVSSLNFDGRKEQVKDKGRSGIRGQ